MRPITLTISFIIAGTLSAWIGYRVAIAKPETVSAGTLPSTVSNGPSSGDSKAFDYATSRKQLIEATRRMNRERSDASYVAHNELMAALPDEALPRLLVDIQNMSHSSERDRLLRDIIPKLAKKDPEKMYTYCMESGLTEYMLSIFEELAKDDAAQAWNRVESFIAKTSRVKATGNNYVYGVFQEWSQQDLDAAFAKALEVDDRLTYHAARGFGSAMSDESRDAFLQSIVDVPEVAQTSHREHFVQFATMWMATEDRGAALNWLYDSGVDQSWITRTEIELADFRDPEATADWLYSTIREDQPNDRIRKMSHIAGNWASRDREATVTWLEAHGEPEMAEKVRSK
jgi:hypothetical protein